jgi:hypothetical protein
MILRRFTWSDGRKKNRKVRKKVRQPEVLSRTAFRTLNAQKRPVTKQDSCEHEENKSVVRGGRIHAMQAIRPTNKRSCPRCRSKQVAKSHIRGAIEEQILRAFRLSAYRCCDCDKRFYGRRATPRSSRLGQPHDPIDTTASAIFTGSASSSQGRCVTQP